MGKGLKALIFGGAVGAAIGVLYAPRSGKKTREMLAKKTDQIVTSAENSDNAFIESLGKGAKNAVDTSQAFIENAQNSKIAEFGKEATLKGQQMFKDTTSAFGNFANQNVKPIFSEKNQDLRSKIENARSKIASQVATNISNVSQTAVEPIPATTKKRETKTASKKPAVKKTSAKKASTKKATPKKASTKKASAKKTTAKKSTKKTASKASAKKTTKK